MMEIELEKIADKLSSSGKCVMFEPNSVLNGIETFSNKETLNTVVNQISNKLNYELVLIKNKLIPFMNDIANLCSEKISKMEDTTDISKYRINTVDIPELLKDLKLAGELGTKREPVKLGTEMISVHTPPADEIRNYFIPKKSKFTHHLENILATKTTDDLITIWEKYLLNISDSNYEFEKLFRYPLTSIDDILLLYSVVENIYDEKPRGCSARDDIYLTVIQIYYKEVKNLLSIVYDNILNNRNIGRLVYGFEDEYTVNVDKELYDKFLEEGGIPEALLGFCLEHNSDLNNCFYSSIKEKQLEYINKWNNKVKLEGFNSLATSVNRYKSLYNIVLKVVYDAYIPKDLEEILVCDYYNANEKLNKLLDTLNNDNILDYNFVSRLIVGDIMFSNSNFSKFAETMLSYMDTNKTFTQQDAATFAAFDLIIEYLTKQVTLVDIQQYENLTKREYNYTWPL